MGHRRLEPRELAGFRPHLNATDRTLLGIGELVIDEKVLALFGNDEFNDGAAAGSERDRLHASPFVLGVAFVPAAVEYRPDDVAAGPVVRPDVEQIQTYGLSGVGGERPVFQRACCIRASCSKKGPASRLGWDNDTVLVAQRTGRAWFIQASAALLSSVQGKHRSASLGFSRYTSWQFAHASETSTAASTTLS